jgi:hypothetical protein
MIPLNSLRLTRETTGAEEGPSEAADRDERGATLMLLTNDAACRSGLRLHTFPDAASAASFIEFWFPPAHRHGLIAFWALNGRPNDAAGPADFALLVRDQSLPGIVHPLSFPDARSAHLFLAAEIAEGLDPRRVIAYWTVPVTVSAGPSGEAKLSPARPPLSRSATAAGQGLTTRPLPATAASAPAPLPLPPKAAPSRRRIDLLAEARKVLRTPRWQTQTDAFQGFGSPPGRF